MATVQSPAGHEPDLGPGITAEKFRDLIATVRKSRPTDDTEIIRKAWEFCLEHHKGQLRASGEPYVLHPLEVALVLAEMKLDSTAIAAGLLHDAVEDEPVPSEVEARREEGEQFLHEVEQALMDRLRESEIKARVEWRIKRLYSISQKLQKSRTSVDQVYDLLAIRVITASVQDCYAVMGLIHSLWRPVPGRIKDFIAMPRPNLYQPLHTTAM